MAGNLVDQFGRPYQMPTRSLVTPRWMVDETVKQWKQAVETMRRLPTLYGPDNRPLEWSRPFTVTRGR